MAVVSTDLTERWKTGRHIAQNRPVQFGRIRRGYFIKDYRPFTFLDGSTEDFATIVKEPAGKPYWAQWTPDTAWMDLPNVSDVSLQQSFDNNGVVTATVTIDNIVMQAIAGVVGTYHLARRGYLSPLRRFTAPGRPGTTWAEVNEWAQIFDSSCQVDIFQGYGTAVARTFTGLIDQVDMTSSPATITLTLRSFAGGALTDQRLFGRNKDPHLRVPITFADRRYADDIEKISGGAKASSSRTGYPVSRITKPGDDTWISKHHDDPNHTEWCQITLKRGRYEDCYVFPEYAGEEMYLSVYVYDRQRKDKKHAQKKSAVDGVAVNEGWYDPVTGGSWDDLTNAEKAARIASGDHIVPGANGGYPYVKKVNSTDNVGKVFRLGGHVFEVGDSTKLRVAFRKMHKTRSFDPKWPKPPGVWLTGAKRVIAYKRKRKLEAKKNQWILVDDASDVVKVVLRWAGYREWEVESFGWRISKDKPWVFHQSDYLIDVINYVKSQGDYVFFEKGPTGHDLSIGVPVFRHQRAFDPPGNEAIKVTDRDLLTGVNPSLNLVARPSVVHVRGKAAKKGQRGQTLGETSRERRVWAKYLPPWGTTHSTRARLANILRHVTHVDNNLASNAECKIAAIMIALQYQLQAFTAHIEIPGYPGIDLDSQVGVIDEGTGVNARIWAADIQSQFTSGENARWTTTVGGSLIDTEDIFNLAMDFFRAIAVAVKENEDGHHPAGRQGIGTAVAQGVGGGVSASG